MEYTNKNGQRYYLHTTLVTLRGGNRKQTIYFFSRVVGGKGDLCELPDGFKIVENKRTGLPCLKRK